MQYLKEYQGFSVDLRELGKVLNLIGKRSLNNAELLEETGFGMNKVRGIKEYLSDFGVLGDKNTLTAVGSIVYQEDPRFRDPFTQWVMLYHWSMKGSNPFLNFLINDLSISADDTMIVRKFKLWAERNKVKTDYEGNKLSGLINRTKSAMLDDAAFQALNLFVSYDDVFQRSDPYNVSPYIVAYILYSQRRGRTSVSFSELLDEKNNAAKFFNWNSKGLEAKMVELMNMKMAKMVHYADLHMLEFSYSGTPNDIIKKYYDEH